MKTRCAARSRRTGEQCGRYVTHGATVCRWHGGQAPQVKAAARQRHVEQEAAKVMAMFGEPVDTSPSEALLDTVKWTAGHVTFLRGKVREIENADDLVWGETKTVNRTSDDEPGQSETTEAAAVNVWVKLLADWSDRLVRVCEAAIRAGIEERKVRLAEQQGALVADVIRRILEDLNLTAEQRGLVGTVVPRHLRAIA